MENYCDCCQIVSVAAVDDDDMYCFEGENAYKKNQYQDDDVGIAGDDYQSQSFVGDAVADVGDVVVGVVDAVAVGVVDAVVVDAVAAGVVDAVAADVVDAVAADVVDAVAADVVDVVEDDVAVDTPDQLCCCCY